MSEETGQAPQTDARALIRNIQSFLSLFIAGAFAVSVIATRSYFSFFSEALNNLLTFSDYIVFTIDFIAPIMVILLAVILWIFFWGSISLVASNLFGSLWTKSANLVGQLWARLRGRVGKARGPKLNLKNFEHALFISSTRLDNTRPIEFVAAARDVKITDRFFFDTENWLYAALFLACSVGVNTAIANHAVSASGAFIAFLFSLGLAGGAINSSITAGFLRLFHVNDTPMRYQSDVDALNTHERDSLENYAREHYERRNIYRSLALTAYGLGGLLIISTLYGEMRGLQTYQTALTPLRVASAPTASDAPNAEHEPEALPPPAPTNAAPTPSNTLTAPAANRVLVAGGDLVRVVDQGVVAFNEQRTEVLFINDYGYIRANYPLNRFLSPEAAARLSPQARENMRNMTSACFGLRHQWINFAALPEIKKIPFTHKPKQCANLFDIHQKLLRAQISAPKPPTGPPTGPEAKTEADETSG